MTIAFNIPDVSTLNVSMPQGPVYDIAFNIPDVST
jgi:hypothetical protein